jgi:radical SAM-linked protein
MNEAPLRYRALFAKTEAMRYTGHLDLHRAWERMLRRSGLPLAYSSGFHPHPRIQIGAALPLGVSGENELMEFRLDEEIAGEAALAALRSAAPPGIELRGVRRWEGGRAHLEEEIVAGDYLVEPLEDFWPAELVVNSARLLASETLPRERRGKPYDLRPLIWGLSREGNTLRMRLQLAPAATGRPEEVLIALALENFPVLIRRTCLLTRTAAGSECQPLGL